MKKRIYRIPSSIPFTQIGYATILQEYEVLVGERPSAVAELKRAREMGDLKENGFYRGARFKLSAIDRRLRELTHLIRYGKVVQTSTDQTVVIGSKVTLDDGKRRQIFFIVGEYEANPSEQKISHKSPLGMQLFGKKAGERVTVQIPSGTVSYTLLQIE